MPLLFPLTIPSSQLQRSVQFSVDINTDSSSTSDFVFHYNTYCYFELMLVSSAQLFDAMSLENVYQPLKRAALYEDALCMVRESKVQYRSLR